MEVIRDWFIKLFTEPPSSILQLLVLYVGAVIAIVGGIHRARKSMCNQLWPSRPKPTWHAQCIPTPPNSDIYQQSQSDPNNAWRKTGRWSNGKPMEVGDWYELYLEKPRTLSEIVVRSQGERFPQKISFWTKENRNNDWNKKTEATITLGHNDQNTIYKYRFKKREKVEAVRIVVIEPTLEPRNKEGRSPSWAIYSIDFKEYRLLGSLWEASIK